MSALNLTFETLTGFFCAIPFGDLLSKNLIGTRELGRSALHSKFQLVIRALEFLFETFVCTDVSHVQEQGRLPKIVNAACTDRYGNRSAIGRQAESLEFVGAVCLQRDNSVAMFGRDQLLRVFS